ncbi:unknow (plasmid) [Vibrio campbellii]|nr:unknow [Vibrio campbellii]
MTLVMLNWENTLWVILVRKTMIPKREKRSVFILLKVA